MPLTIPAPAVAEIHATNNNQPGVIKQATALLQVDSNHIKALYQRARACLASTPLQLGLAETDVAKGLALAPGHADFLRLKAVIDKKNEEYAAREVRLCSKIDLASRPLLKRNCRFQKQAFKGMFERL